MAVNDRGFKACGGAKGLEAEPEGLKWRKRAPIQRKVLEKQWI